MSYNVIRLAEVADLELLTLNLEQMKLEAELEKKITTEMENKYFPKFEKQAAYLGNGVYSIPATNIYSTNTRELFLMFVAAQENISFKQR